MWKTKERDLDYRPEVSKGRLNFGSLVAASLEKRSTFQLSGLLQSTPMDNSDLQGEIEKGPSYRELKINGPRYGEKKTVFTVFVFIQSTEQPANDPRTVYKMIPTL